MHIAWLSLVARVLRPARPRLAACLRERERHLEARRQFAQERAREIAGCVARIEAARAEVFAANDGVVTRRMTDLEREWRRLSRVDPDAGLMDLWAKIAPFAWLDRKEWRGADRASQLDVAVALAADVDGVEAARAAVEALRATSGAPIGARVRWRAFAGDFEGTPDLLARPLEAACGRMSSVVKERARRLEHEVAEAAQARFPERPALARALAHAAFVDAVCGAAGPSPVAPLRDLWSLGYTLSAVDESGVVIEVPPL